MARPYRILLVSGSLRANSINTAVLRTARAVAPHGIDAVLYERLADLPHFNPDDDAEPFHPASPNCAPRFGRRTRSCSRRRNTPGHFRARSRICWTG